MLGTALLSIYPNLKICTAGHESVEIYLCKIKGNSNKRKPILSNSNGQTFEFCPTFV